MPLRAPRTVTTTIGIWPKAESRRPREIRTSHGSMRAPTCEEYQVPAFVSANAVSARLKRECEPCGSTRGIAPAIVSAQALFERVQLSGQLRRQVVEFGEVLPELRQLAPPLVGVDPQQL